MRSILLLAIALGASPASASLLAKPCRNDPLSRSRCMVELILADIARTGAGVGGGGIEQIRAIATESWIVTLPMEERVDIFTYRFTLSDGTVAIRSRTVTTRSMGR